MIQPQTILKVIDNSGAKVIRCFRILGGTRKRYAQLGDIMIASVQVAEPRREVKKKAVVKALIVRQRKAFRRKDGSYIRFSENAAVLVNEKKEPLGNRIFGPIAREIKEKGYGKISGLAPELV